MSVQTLDPKVFNYMRSGIEKAAYNNTINDFYYYPISQHFRDRDIENESLRLVRSWSDMNEKSYSFKYKEPFESIAKFIRPDFTHKPLTPVQLLKYVECLHYNIEPEHWELSEQEKTDLELLTKFRDSICTAIVSQLLEYKTAAWSEA